MPAETQFYSYEKNMSIEGELAISATEGMIKKEKKYEKTKTVKILGLEREAVLSRHCLGTHLVLSCAASFR